MTLSELIAKLEEAGAEDQTDVVRAALRFALDQGWITADAYRRAQEMCNAGAFLDAALTLLPEGMGARLLINTVAGRCSAASVIPTGGGDSNDLSVHIGMERRTPALALCIASLRAREA
jgi:hypothetical protein